MQRGSRADMLEWEWVSEIRISDAAPAGQAAALASAAIQAANYRRAIALVIPTP